MSTLLFTFNFSYPLMLVNDCNSNDSLMRSVQTALVVTTIKHDYYNFNIYWNYKNKSDFIFGFQSLILYLLHII